MVWKQPWTYGGGKGDGEGAIGGYGGGRGQKVGMEEVEEVVALVTKEEGGSGKNGGG